MVGLEHDCVSRGAVRAQRGQRAARGPDGIEFVNLNSRFSPACLLHDMSPLRGRFIAVATSRPYNWRALEAALREPPLYLANRADVSPGCFKKSFGFS